jgi:hypothetical protein
MKKEGRNKIPAAFGTLLERIGPQANLVAAIPAPYAAGLFH